VSFKANKNLTKELAREPWAREMLQENVDAVEEEAMRASPLGSDFVGYYGRFKTIVRRLTGTVGNTDVAAHLIEFGSVNNPAYAPLRRGVQAAGLRFADDSDRSNPDE
jgi:hypothetical protein